MKRNLLTLLICAFSFSAFSLIVNAQTPQATPPPPAPPRSGTFPNRSSKHFRTDCA